MHQPVRKNTALERSTPPINITANSEHIHSHALLGFYEIGTSFMTQPISKFMPLKVVEYIHPITKKEPQRLNLPHTAF